MPRPLTAYARAQRFGRVPTKPRPNADGSTGGKSPYRLGRDFERAIRGRLERKSYFVMRAHGSKGKIDLLAVKGTIETLERVGDELRASSTYIVLGVQCKRRGDIGSAEWNELMDVCEPHGITPVVAVKLFESGKDSVAFYRLDERRIPRKPGRPWTLIDHATGEPLPVQTAML